MAGQTEPWLEQDPEIALCGSFREPFMFWLWQRMAGAPKHERAAHIAGVEKIHFKTRDGISLGGYKLAAVNPTAYLLVAQGNAMLADQLVADLQTFRDLAWDVFIYDYRGYGNSQGKSRLAAIVNDYREIVGRYFHGRRHIAQCSGRDRSIQQVGR
jgi:hypothetical protein